MSPTVTPQRRRLEEDSDGEEDSLSADSSRSSQTGKRPRRRVNGDKSTVQSALLPDDYLSRHNAVRKNGASRAPATHQPGSIVRVKLENFVTYSAVEIFPGPSLNMVIGPNGTGKSTLVCAICLGLGWEPKYLGRQKELSEFVKHGQNEAYIEIELCRMKGLSRNPVIQCHIKRDGNKALYSLNGKNSTKKQVQGLARKFSIQIDNLCQFLPQDKVVEFAAMSPVDLLRSTQEAVGSKKMLVWHDQLKEYRKNQKSLQTTLTNNLETLENYKGRQRMQEADVARMREREQVKENIRLWKGARPFAEYRETRDRHREEMKNYKAAQKELETLEEDVEPALRAVTAKAQYRDMIKRVMADREKALDSSERAAKASSQKVEILDRNLKDIGRDMEAEKSSGHNDRQDLKRIQGIIAGLEVSMRQEPPEFDVTTHNERARAKERRRNEIQEEGASLQAERATLKRDGQRRVDEIARKQSDIENLDSRVGQQTNKLSRHAKDTSIAWEYIQEHQGEFEKQVYGPPIVECSVKDPRYVDMVECFFQKSDLITLTVQTRSDFLKLNEMVHERLKLAHVNIRTVLSGLEKFRPPISRDEMKVYGIDGWALDYISGPEPVLTMLCDSIKLHQAGVANKDTTPEQYQLIEKSPVALWVTNKSMYRIARRREYGSGATSTSVRDLRPGTIWTDQPVDLDTKRALEREIAEMNSDNMALKQKLREVASKLESLKEENSALEQELGELQAEKEAKHKAISAFKALPTRLATQQDKKADIEVRIDGIRDRVRELMKTAADVTLEKCQAALDNAAAVEKLRQAHGELQEVEVMLIEAISDQEVLLERNKEVQIQLERRRSEVKEFEMVLQVNKRKAKAQFVETSKIHEEADEALKTFLTEHRTEVTEQVDQEIGCEEARLELIHEGNGGVIQEFQIRAKKIEHLEEEVQRVNMGLAEVDVNIDSIRSQWEPKLDKLVARISDAFAYNMQQIKCAGEVGVRKDQDFDQWAIKIMVKFRENESLSQLDSHRQSGGERAVSTIFYLMSLQTLTRSPFRVVDEINQGMDPRNERLVHARMVAIAAGNDEWEQQNRADTPVTSQPGDGPRGSGSDEDGGGDEGGDSARNADSAGKKSGGGSQYFLITPKLLHGLRYEEGMRVLCITSGEHFEEQAVDFTRALEIRRGMAASASG